MQCRAIYSPAGREASFGGGLCTGCSHQNTLRGAMTTWQQQRLYLHALAWVGREFSGIAGMAKSERWKGT